MGPMFSGTFDLLRTALVDSSASNMSFRVLSGTATNPQAALRFRIGLKAVSESVYNSVTHNDYVRGSAFLNYYCWLSPVARNLRFCPRTSRLSGLPSGKTLEQTSKNRLRRRTRKMFKSAPGKGSIKRSQKTLLLCLDLR